MLAQHAHVCLELENNLKSLDNSPNYISYANELWTSIVFLSKTIVAKARDVFSNLANDSSSILIDAMCSIYLLENVTLKEIFQMFLVERTVKIFLLYLKLILILKILELDEIIFSF